MMTWILLRAAGIGAYVALWLSVAWGLVATTGIVEAPDLQAGGQRLPRVRGHGRPDAARGPHRAARHRRVSCPSRVLDVLIPMRSTFRPLALTAGVIAMYAIVILMVSSWSRSKMSTRLWRTIHLLAVPAFVLALLHGVFAGTDTQRPWMIALYGTTGVLTFFLVIVRGLTADYRPPRPTPPRSAPPPGRRPPGTDPGRVGPLAAATHVGALLGFGRGQHGGPRSIARLDADPGRAHARGRARPRRGPRAHRRTGRRDHRSHVRRARRAGRRSSASSASSPRASPTKTGNGSATRRPDTASSGC